MRLHMYLTEGQRARVLSHAEGLSRDNIEQLLDLVKTNKRFAHVCVQGIFDGDFNVSMHNTDRILTEAAIHYEHIARELTEHKQPDSTVYPQVQKTAVEAWCSVAVAVVCDCLPADKVASTYQPGYLNAAIAAVGKWPKAAEKALQRGRDIIPRVDGTSTDGLLGDYISGNKSKLVSLFTIALSHESVARDFVFNHPEMMDVELGGKPISEHISERYGEKFIATIEAERTDWHVEQIKAALR